MTYYNLQDTPEYKKGATYEKIAQNIIKKYEKVDIIETCNNSDYDFKDSNGITYEIKNDSLSIKTKHFFITYKQQFKNNNYFTAAGISNSKSDFYMLRYGNEFYKIKTATLKMIIFNNMYIEDNKDNKETLYKHLEYNNTKDNKETLYKHLEYNNNRGDIIRGIRVPAVDIVKDSIIYLIED